MKRIREHLLLTLAAIPALVVTGVSLIALVSGGAEIRTANAPPVVLSTGEGPATTQPASTPAPNPAQALLKRAGVEGPLMSSVSAMQLQPERLPRQTIRPRSTVGSHTAIVPAVVRPPVVAPPQPSGNASGDRSGSNSGSGSSSSGEDRGHDDDNHHDDDHHDDDHEHEDEDDD